MVIHFMVNKIKERFNKTWVFNGSQFQWMLMQKYLKSVIPSSPSCCLMYALFDIFKHVLIDVFPTKSKWDHWYWFTTLGWGTITDWHSFVNVACNIVNFVTQHHVYFTRYAMEKEWCYWEHNVSNHLHVKINTAQIFMLLKW